MERLTQRDEYGNADIIVLSDMMPEIYAGLSFSETNALTDALNRLAAYEDAEEQGRLLVLPCKVGDPVYYLTGNQILANGYHFSRVESTKCVGFYFDEKGLQIALYMPHGNHGTYGYFGETVFCTLEEAEAKMDGGVNDAAD